MLANEGNVSFLIGFEVVLQKKKKLFCGYRNMQIIFPFAPEGIFRTNYHHGDTEEDSLWVTHDPSSLLRKEAR